MRENELSHLSPEDRLFLLISRGGLTSEEQLRARGLLALPLRWPELLGRVYDHQTWPLVYRNLRELGFFAVPDAIQTELKRAYLATVLMNQRATDELAGLLHRLSDAGIPAVPLKGVYLANSLYEDPASRVCTDIDLLVPPSELDHTLEIIRAAGYSDFFTDGFFRRLDLCHGRHYSFERRSSGYSSLIELHWQVVQHSSRDIAAVTDLWCEARRTCFFGAPAHQLSPEWQFLYLCVHVADHEWRGIKWLVDVHQICTSQPPAWQEVQEKAKRFGFELAVCQTLAACSLLLGTPLPELYSSVSLPPKLRASSLALTIGPPRVFSHLSLLERPWDKLRCVANVVLVPKPADRNFLRVPEVLSFLYYPLRALRLIAKRV